MQRLATAAVGVPLLLLAVFLLPDLGFLALVVLVIDAAALEYVRLVRPWAPHAPLRGLLAIVPAAAVGLVLLTAPEATGVTDLGMLAAGLLLTVGVGTLVLLGGTPVNEALPALGAFAFGVPYFTLAIFAIYRLKSLDPWLVVLGLAVIFLGDTAAYYVGRRLGRHKLAPVVSPNKSWEGSAAGLAAAVGAAAVWGWLRLGEVPLELLAVAALTGMVAQIGDLVESMLKRGSGVKDSGQLLPGHGGVLDRADAVLFAFPVLLAGIWWIGPELLIR
ncbi:MAG TPA: phosphatidate cytidylyltransferase [Thermoanaerobaculia bacterium]|nr:phosphatidate cytidylyltransferase [Thermoanaerobaculia bacterium]